MNAEYANSNVFALGIVLVISSVIVLGALALLIYFLIYKSSINKRVKSQGNTEQQEQHKARSLPSPSSTVYVVLAIAVAAIMVGIWLDVRAAVRELQGTCSDLSARVANLESQVSYLESEIDSVTDEVENRESLFTNIDISYDNVDFKNHCAKITISAAPKSIAENSKIAVQIESGSSVELKKSGSGLYSGEITIDFYKQYPDTPIIAITQGGTTYSEALDIYIDEVKLKYSAALKNMLSGLNYSYENGRLEMLLYCEPFYEGGFFEEGSLRLVVKSGDKTVMEEAVLSEEKKSCEIESGSSVEISVTALDKSGNTHIIVFYSDFITEEEMGSLDSFLIERVYDGDGKLVAEY